MSASNPHPTPRLLPVLLCSSIAAVMNYSAVAAEWTDKATRTQTQIGRYSTVDARPSAGQRDLLSVTRAITIPRDIDNVGAALQWLLRDSGYRLAAEAVLSDEVRAMLALPLPAVHRRFEPMPLKTVMGLLIGPAFHLVQDPVHRLIAFERCSDTASGNATGGAQ